MVTRRFFIGGAAAAGAFGGCRFFRSPHGASDDVRPSMTFGVVSDVHVLGANAAPGEFCEFRGDTALWRRTLEWFRDRGVDAVMAVGDMADYGMVEELEALASTWNEVFPGGRAPDGRRVEKLFTSGNHEINGFLYDDYAKVKFPDMAERRKHVLRADFARHWERILGEPYSHFSVKEIKGYRFLTTHWGDDTDMSVGWCKNRFGIELQDFLDRNGRSIDPSRPFFYYQHPHLKDTCFGSWAWGRDDGKSTRALSRYANAVAFSGHAHYPLTDERNIWQGGFTSLGTSSLRFSEFPHASRGDFGYENSGGADRDADTVKTTPLAAQGGSPQGMLVKVYDDRLVISRHEFPSGVSLGDDWVVPTSEARPFAFASRAKKAKAPLFGPGASIAVRQVKASVRKGKGGMKDAVEVSFPSAASAEGGRVMDYEITVTGDGGGEKTFALLDAAFNRPAEVLPRSVNRFTLAMDRLPSGKPHFKVVPCDCWRNRGTPIKG
jgi:hypothetical protein